MTSNKRLDPYEALERYYPNIIAQMPMEFNSYEFIQKLGSQHQQLYLQAVNEYADSKRPFQFAHGRLAQALHKFTELVIDVDHVFSPDLFGDKNETVVWRRQWHFGD